MHLVHRILRPMVKSWSQSDRRFITYGFSQYFHKMAQKTQKHFLTVGPIEPKVFYGGDAGRKSKFYYQEDKRSRRGCQREVQRIWGRQEDPGDIEDVSDHVPNVLFHSQVYGPNACRIWALFKHFLILTYIKSTAPQNETSGSC